MPELQLQPAADSSTNTAASASQLHRFHTFLPLKMSDMLHKEEGNNSQGWLNAFACFNAASQADAAAPEALSGSPAIHTLCSNDGRCLHSQHKGRSSWRQGLSRAADRLSFKTVLDMNSGVCTAELAWQVRADNQPARLAVKLSNRHSTRVQYDLQAAIRSTTHVLRLAGHPHGISTASLIVKPLHQNPGWSNSAVEAGSRPSSCFAAINPGAADTNESNRPPAANKNSRSAAGCGAATQQQPACATMQQQLRHRNKRPAFQPMQQPGPVMQAADSNSQPGSHADRLLNRHSMQRTSDSPGAAGNPAAVQSTGPQSARPFHWRPGQVPAVPVQFHQEQQAAASPVQAASIHWEVGWNWKLGGPVAAITKQCASTNTSSAMHPLALQQLKAAYDIKARGMSLTVSGAVWNVVMVLPTPGKGLSGLLPRLDQPGCRPKVTLSLVPELTCF